MPLAKFLPCRCQSLIRWFPLLVANFAEKRTGNSPLRLALFCRAVAGGRGEASLAVGERFEELPLGEFQTFGKRSAEVQISGENNGGETSQKVAGLEKAQGLFGRSARRISKRERETSSYADGLLPIKSYKLLTL